VQPIGYWTKYTYDVLNDLLTVTQSAQGTGTHQTRTYAYDGLGRMTSEQNPEINQTAYTYTFDTEGTSCNTTYRGDPVKRIDPEGTVTCYAYDGLHRLTSATYPSGGYSSVTPAKYYVYDSATVDGAAMGYAKGRLAEAYTGTSKTTDLGFSYTNRGEVATAYQSSPHSSGYYHIAAAYWPPQGLLDVLTPNMGSSIPNWTYGLDGEGRVNTVSSSIGGQQNPVTATSYNGFSEPLGITFGSADSDAFTYDPNTGRMTQYKANVGSAAMSGALTWNAN
jgi:YD repeat-containing protein